MTPIPRVSTSSRVAARLFFTEGNNKGIGGDLLAEGHIGQPEVTQHLTASHALTSGSRGAPADARSSETRIQGRGRGVGGLRQRKILGHGVLEQIPAARRVLAYESTTEPRRTRVRRAPPPAVASGEQPQSPRAASPAPR